MKSRITQERIIQERRMRINPLIELSARKLRSALDAFKCGYLGSATRIWEEIETKSFNLLESQPSRFGKVSRLSWSIAPFDDAPKKTATEHAALLSDFYNNLRWSHALDYDQSGGFSNFIEHVLDSIGKKYSVHELIWNPRPDIRKLRADFKFVPLYFFENTIGKMRFLNTPFALEGVELEKNGWHVAARKMPLMEATSIAYIMQNMAMTDWMTFSARFGSALAVLKQTAQRGTPDFEKAVSAMADLENETSFVISPNDDFKIEQANGQNSPFKEILDYFGRHVIAMWQGSDLGTLSSKDGAGASLQGETTDALQESDCVFIEDALSDISRYVIEYYYGKGVEPAGYLRFNCKTREGLKNKKEELEILEKSAAAGIKVSQKTWCERAGIQPASDGEDVINAPSGVEAKQNQEPAANESDIERAELLELAKARALDIAPLLSRLDKFSNETDNVYDWQSAQLLLSELPELLRAENASKALADAMIRAAQITGENFENENAPKTI